MSRNDLGIRIRRRLRGSLTRVRHRLGLETLPIGAISLNAAFAHPIDSTRKRELVQQYRDLFPDAEQPELDEAGRLLDHRFHLLGHDMVHPEKVAWSRDPGSGADWSNQFSPDITYRGPDRLGDIKLPWELAKHQYFFTLGKAGWLTGDVRFPLEIRNQIDQWIGANPCHRGIHWISALESGTRALSWMLAYPFFAESCDDAFRARMAQSIAQHLLFVEQNLSDGTHANTHLVGEAAILVVGGLFVTCKRSKHWIRTGIRHLDAQIGEQVHRDGVHAEQSVAYHRFFLDQYYLADAFLQANGRSLARTTVGRIEEMTFALMNLLLPDGSAPAFGDCDDARGIWCRADCTKEYRSLLSLGASRFGRSDFRYVARGLTEEVLWLYGAPGVAAFTALPALEPPHTSVSFPDAGYYVLRGGWDDSDNVLVFDCGPLGRGAAGHGHADALSLQLYAGGYAFLVDPGTYSYNLDYDWRRYFRSTRAHNTITIDGLDQSEQRDRMSWQHAAPARCRHWTSTPDFDLVDGEHDGYARLTDPASHRRVVVFLKPDVWFIFDLLDSTAEHAAELNFHLKPDCTLGSGTTGPVALHSPNGPTLFVHGSFATPGARGQSWHSHEYGQRSPSQMLLGRRTFRGTTTLVTGLSTNSDHGYDVRSDVGALIISPAVGSNRTSTLFYRYSGNTSLSNRRLSFDGALLFCDDRPGHSAVIHAERLKFLAYGDELELRSPRAIKKVELRSGRLTMDVEKDLIDQLVVNVPSEVTVVIRQH